MTKICKKCKIEKHISEFPIHKQHRDGHENRCCECKKQRRSLLRRKKGIGPKEERYKIYGNNPIDWSTRTRKCKVCGIVKSIDSDFRKDGRYDNTFHGRCKECDKAYNKRDNIKERRRLLYKINSKKYKPHYVYTCTLCYVCEMEENNCSQLKCLILRDIRNYVTKYKQCEYRKKYNHDKKRRDERAKKYRERYKNDIVFRQKEILKTRNSKLKRKKHISKYNHIKLKQAHELYNEFNKCPYCGCDLNKENKTLDHMDPLSRGGDHSIDNLIVCCRHCNSRKGARTFIKWANELGGMYKANALSIYMNKKNSKVKVA